ncbi:MAG: phosphatidylinositol mannoside acyltransferase [Acidimicrobiales bacterium]
MGSARPHPALTKPLAELRRIMPYYAYRAGAAIAQALPTPIAVGFAQASGVVAGRAFRGRRAMMARHMARISGGTLSGHELESAVDRAFSSYGRYWLESFRLSRQDAASLEAGMVYEGVGHLEAAMAHGRGVILAMPHIGAWDWGGAWLASSGFPVTVVAEALEPVELYEWFAAWRQQLGMEVVPLGRDAGAGVIAALRRGRVAGLLCDRDLTGDGIEVEFFGERTRLPGGPAMLAVRTGAPLIPCCALFEGDHRRGIIRAPLDTSRRGSLRDDVQRITQDLADALAELIRLAPEQWHVFQPNWPSDL